MLWKVVFIDKSHIIADKPYLGNEILPYLRYNFISKIFHEIKLLVFINSAPYLNYFFQ